MDNQRTSDVDEDGFSLLDLDDDSDGCVPQEILITDNFEDSSSDSSSSFISQSRSYDESCADPDRLIRRFFMKMT